MKPSWYHVIPLISQRLTSRVAMKFLLRSKFLIYLFPLISFLKKIKKIKKNYSVSAMLLILHQFATSNDNHVTAQIITAPNFSHQEINKKHRPFPVDATGSPAVWSATSSSSVFLMSWSYISLGQLDTATSLNESTILNHLKKVEPLSNHLL